MFNKKSTASNASEVVLATKSILKAANRLSENLDVKIWAPPHLKYPATWPARHPAASYPVPWNLLFSA